LCVVLPYFLFQYMQGKIEISAPIIFFAFGVGFVVALSQKNCILIR